MASSSAAKKMPTSLKNRGKKGPAPSVPLGSPIAAGIRHKVAHGPAAPTVVHATNSPSVMSPSAAGVSSWFVGEHRTCEAYVLDAPGPVTALRLEKRWIVPPPAPGEVRVRVHAVSLNPGDYVAAARKLPAYPVALGLDVAGVVDVIGPAVAGFAAGDAVYYHGDMEAQYGGFGQYSITTTATMRHVPEGMDFETAAAIPSAAWTAHCMLGRCTMSTRDVTSRSVFITGGGGGVGSQLVQLAAMAGSTVLTSCGASNAKFVERLGASENFNYRGIGEVRRAVACHARDVVGRSPGVVARAGRGFGPHHALDRRRRGRRVAGHRGPRQCKARPESVTVRRRVGVCRGPAAPRR